MDHNQPAGPGQSMSPQHMRALNKLPLGLLVIGGEGEGILTTLYMYQNIDFANSVPQHPTKECPVMLNSGGQSEAYWLLEYQTDIGRCRLT